MSQPTISYVDPSSLSLPSSSLKRSAPSPSPAPSSHSDSPSPSANTEPPRKRPRAGVSPEERKEARAHRNRIAAQNSRDRRKAQFSFLEQRVAELEEENRRLRAESNSVATAHTPHVPRSTARADADDSDEKKRKDNDVREQENEELRERIKTLEKGYEAVLRALATQGTPQSSSTASNNSNTSPPQPTLVPSSSSTPPASTTTSTSITSLPLSPPLTHASPALSSPALFDSEFDFPIDTLPLDAPLLDLDLNISSLPTTSLPSQSPTRHLARVATTGAQPCALVSLQRVGLRLSEASVIRARVNRDEAKVLSTSATSEGYDYHQHGQTADNGTQHQQDDALVARLLAEILAPSPVFTPNALPQVEDEGTALVSGTEPAAKTTTASSCTLARPSNEVARAEAPVSGVSVASSMFDGSGVDSVGVCPSTKLDSGSRLESTSGTGMRTTSATVNINDLSWAEEMRMDMEAIDMQRMLGMLPTADDGERGFDLDLDFPSALDLGLEMGMEFESDVQMDGVGVF